MSYRSLFKIKENDFLYIPHNINEISNKEEMLDLIIDIYYYSLLDNEYERKLPELKNVLLKEYETRFKDVNFSPKKMYWIMLLTLFYLYYKKESYFDVETIDFLLNMYESITAKEYELYVTEINIFSFNNLYPSLLVRPYIYYQKNLTVSEDILGDIGFTYNLLIKKYKAIKTAFSDIKINLKLEKHRANFSLDENDYVVESFINMINNRSYDIMTINSTNKDLKINLLTYIDAFFIDKLEIIDDNLEVSKTKNILVDILTEIYLKK